MLTNRNRDGGGDEWWDLNPIDELYNDFYITWSHCSSPNIHTHTYAIHSDERAIPALNVSINRILKKSKLDFELVIHSFRYLYI